MNGRCDRKTIYKNWWIDVRRKHSKNSYLNINLDWRANMFVLVETFLHSVGWNPWFLKPAGSPWSMAWETSEWKNLWWRLTWRAIFYYSKLIWGFLKPVHTFLNVFLPLRNGNLKSKVFPFFLSLSWVFYITRQN